MLYEIERERIDFRRTDEYLDNLVKLLTFFPDTIVFHNIDLEFLKSRFSQAQFIELPLKDLRLYSDIEKINEISLKYSAEISKDLVYSLPYYGFLVNSKIELLHRSLVLTRSQKLAWVDAGIMRFIDNGSDFQNTTHLNRDIPVGVFEIDLWNALKSKKYSFSKMRFKNLDIGTSYRLIGGSFFILDRSIIKECDDIFYALVKSHLDRGEWDTEQFFLSKMMKVKKFDFYVQQRKTPTSFFNDFYFQNSKKKLIKFPFTKLFF